MVLGQSAAPGYWLQARSPESEPSESPSLSPEQRVERFRVMSSPVAQRLMGLVAASPVITLPVIRLIQETLLPQSRQMNVAEVLLGGLLEPTQPPQLGVNPDEVEYRFVDEGIRERLLKETPVPDTVQVLSKYIERQFNRSLDEFVAELQVWSQSEDAALVEKTRPFARVTASVLKRKGGKYREFVEQIETRVGAKGLSPLQDVALQEFEFETAKIAIEEEETLQPFEFEMATVEVQRKGIFRRPSQVIIHRERKQAWGYVERLSETVGLEMVAIREGRFQMGSPKNEPERYDNESPQHEMSVPAFFMGKYPVTQAQWKIIAGLPQVERELNPDPSEFKGEDCPVENVSWHDATEFCARLSELTGKPYRLPSEAEWEYACRAGTTTPFHFGKLITPELANYNWSSSYGSVEVTKEKDFRGTTPVGRFGVANAFGLYDMHGNVWEWCEDCWHDNYQGAPNDGSAWIDSEAPEGTRRVLRGGSWVNNPRVCRSATRDDYNAEIRFNLGGFRVVCGAPRTL
jgi:formylglycine-generating enzyme required for sulfatase activity